MIIRRRHTANFTTISNRLFDDERLVADEVGILAYLLSRPDNWEIRRPALARRWGIGPISVKRIVRSWMKAGWCTATKVRLPNGTFCILYDISDVPGKEMTEDEVREALSLVSSEASYDDPDPISEADNHPHVPDDPPPRQPVLAGHPLVTGGVAYKEITNTELPKDESDQKAERELARAREKHALGLVEFKRRWPTAASDDQSKTDEAWFALEFDEGDAALAGIPLFLEKLKRDKRTTVPAGWKYLREKRWTLLETTAAAPHGPTIHARDSTEAKAVGVLFKIAKASSFFHSVVARHGSVSYAKEITPQLAALDHPQAHREADWVELSHQQACAWEAFLREFVTVQVRKHLVAGDRAPWPWPPSVEGKLYPITGPPEVLMSDQDAADFK